MNLLNTMNLLQTKNFLWMAWLKFCKFGANSVFIFILEIILEIDNALLWPLAHSLSNKILMFKVLLLFSSDLQLAVRQTYETEADNEYVILGNSAIMKCEIPSFVSDLIEVSSWQDDSGHIYQANDNTYGKLYDKSMIHMIIQFCLFN